MTIAGFEADGGRVGGSGRRTGGDHDDGEEMASFPASWVSGASTVDAGGNGVSGEADYLARARYLTGGRKGLKVVGADAVSVRTVRGRQGSLVEEEGEGEGAQLERELTLPDLRRRLGKLERAVGGLRMGLTTETNDFRRNAAGTLLVELSNELEGLRTTIASRAGTGVNADSSEYDSNSDESEFTYPTSPAAPSSSSSRSRRPRRSDASRTTSASTDYFHVAGSQVPDITTVLSESEAFRVPTHEAGLKVRRPTGGMLSPMIARAEWERDELATDCRRCRRRFTFFLRKHHCRRCGLVVCDSCSPHRVLLPPSDIVLDPNTPFSRLQDEIHVEHRTCDPCFAEVTTPALGRSLASVSESSGTGGSGSREGGSSVASDLAECPVCNRTLADFGGLVEQEAHVRACLEDGGSSVQAGRYLVYRLKPESSLVGVECVICLEEFLSGSKVARLNCLCSFHDHCLSSWLSRGRSCPVHARET
ncbi:hypothetical protein BDY24DRAFT_400096 [Mrakia frigida]|uniref:FYVE zinc finger/RING finger protein n=1 Tax=Mrakia frigida TaxID=29902 RepID=UPI003FCC0959